MKIITKKNVFLTFFTCFVGFSLALVIWNFIFLSGLKGHFFLNVETFTFQTPLTGLEGLGLDSWWSQTVTLTLTARGMECRDRWRHLGGQPGRMQSVKTASGKNKWAKPSQAKPSQSGASANPRAVKRFVRGARESHVMSLCCGAHADAKLFLFFFFNFGFRNRFTSQRQ